MDTFYQLITNTNTFGVVLVLLMIGLPGAIYLATRNLPAVAAEPAIEASQIVPPSSPNP